MSWYGADASFARAQREYENRMPPEPDEVVMQVSCGNSGDRTVRGYDGSVGVMAYECCWEGKTEVYILNGMGTFECPDCKYENEIEVDDEDFGYDPDEHYDRMREDEVIERLREDEAGV